jgi:hypothetical protein
MKIIGKLNLKDGGVRVLGEQWVDDNGQPATVQVEGRKDRLKVILGGIRYVPESVVEIYDGDDLDEVRTTPAYYELFGFIPFVDANGNPSGMPHTEVDTVWASEVRGFRSLWLRDDVLDAYDDIKRDGEEDDDDEPPAVQPLVQENGQPAAPSP